MLVPLLLLLFVFVAVSFVTASQARQRLLDRLRTEWGQPRDRERQSDLIADFFRAHETPDASLDDRTWNDLLLDDVFCHLDRTESGYGQQLLYRRLRSAPAPHALAAFDALVMRVADDTSLRERAQTALARLNDPTTAFVHRLARPDALVQSDHHVLLPVWSATVALTLLLGIVWHGLLLIAPLAFVVNMVIRGMTERRVSAEAARFRLVGVLLSSARVLRAVGTPETAPLTGTLEADLGALRRLGAMARWVTRPGATAAGELVGVVLEYLNILFLMDANALFFAGRELRARAPQLLNVIETVGEIDAAIAIASFRAEATAWTRPQFLEPHAPATFTGLRHPMVEDPVPNSIVVAPPHGVLITGSNMSGKSTFLRTVGINVVLAQTINMCLAESYAAPVYHVRSCIGRSDDLLAGKSYYLVEVESVLALVRASEQAQPHLFIFDELFRGTNAVERIAAADAVLASLVSAGKAHVVLAATHDGELVDLLQDRYVVYHLGDAISEDGLTFDYRLTAGPATSRNAIALLRLNGAPESLVTRAMTRAEMLDRQRQRT